MRDLYLEAFRRNPVPLRPLRVYEFLRGLSDVAEGLLADAELVARVEREAQNCDFWGCDHWGHELWFDPGVISWEPRLVFGAFDPDFPESVCEFFVDQRVRQIRALTTFTFGRAA